MKEIRRLIDKLKKQMLQANTENKLELWMDTPNELLDGKSFNQYISSKGIDRKEIEPFILYMKVGGNKRFEMD